jgi:hypothetical protein
MAPLMLLCDPVQQSAAHLASGDKLKLEQDRASCALVLLQAGAAAPSAPPWHIHHVNLQAQHVREAVAFYTDIIGMAEGRWQSAAQRGDFSIDPAELAVLTNAGDNRVADFGAHPPACILKTLINSGLRYLKL